MPRPGDKIKLPDDFEQTLADLLAVKPPSDDQEDNEDEVDDVDDPKDDD